MERILNNEQFNKGLMSIIRLSIREELKTVIQDIELKVNSLDKKIGKTVIDTEYKLDAFEQYSRANNLIIHGVEEVAHSQNTVIQLCKEKLHINIDVDAIDIAHRL